MIFINQDMIAVLFRFINFIALLGLFAILFKKYIMPDLLLDMAQKKNTINALYDQQATLEKQRVNLDVFLKNEALMCQTFRSSLDEWKKVVALECDSRKKENERIAVGLIKRYTQKIHEKERIRIQNIVTEAVILDLEKYSSHHFADQKNNSNYLNSIIHYMNEKKL
ncbi:MAG TPA: hypothetical protein VLB80_03590 [Candidatus Babeliales bacterium]|nr:hypothetical protein [Candidatus Babeliales bacterium]